MSAPRRQPTWIDLRDALVLHAMQISDTGGSGAIRSLHLLESALERPKNLLHDAPEEATLPRMAAAYAFGIIHNHPFVDGNKRTGLVVAYTFLEINGFAVEAEQEDTYLIFLGLADGSVDELLLAAWLTTHAFRKKKGAS